MMIDEEMEKMLRENLELTRENNAMLRKQIRAMYWSRFFKFTYWFFIIALALGAYYYIQPVIDSLKESYGVSSTSIGDALRNVQQFKESVAGTTTRP